MDNSQECTSDESICRPKYLWTVMTYCIQHHVLNLMWGHNYIINTSWYDMISLRCNITVQSTHYLSWYCLKGREIIILIYLLKTTLTKSTQHFCFSLRLTWFLQSKTGPSNQGPRCKTSWDCCWWRKICSNSCKTVVLIKFQDQAFAKFSQDGKHYPSL